MRQRRSAHQTAGVPNRTPNFSSLLSINFLPAMQTVRRQRQDIGKCSRADGDHHE